MSLLIALKKVPLWLQMVLLAIQLLFIIAIYNITSSLYADYQKHQRHLDALDQHSLYRKAIIHLGEFRGLCALASIQSTTKAHIASLCDEARFQVDDAFEKLGIGITERETLIDQEGAYYEVFLRETAYSEQLLNDLFALYRDSGIQLEEETDTYTTSRIIFVHLPDLIEKFGFVRGLTGLAMNDSVSQSSLYLAQGRVLEILSNTRNTIEAYETTSNSSAPSELLLDFEIIEESIISHIERLNTLRYESVNRNNLDLDFTLFIQATDVIDEIQTMLADTQSIYTEKLHEDQQATLIHLVTMLLGGALLQLLLLLMYRFVLQSVMEIEITSEKAVQASKSLAHTLEKQDRMFAIIGHELRTPAAALNMQLNEIEMRSPETTGVSEAIGTSQHLLDVLDDMRVGSDSSLITEHREASYLSIEQLVKEASDTLNYTAAQYKVQLALSIQNDTHQQHIGFRKQIRQIVINLTKNAIIHSQGDKICVNLSSQPQGSNTQFTVQISDNGTGIPSEEVEQLFSAFTRGKTTSSGTGLGLHISRELARSFNQGDLVYSANPEGGSVFTFTFTLRRVDSGTAAAAAAAAAKEHNLKNKKVLFVEDTATLRMLGKSLLAREGAEVIDVENGEQALQAFDTESFDLVMTDIMMPEMDGYQLTEALRAKGFNQPIIGLTGATVGNEAEKLLESGADRVLPKPLNLDSLQQVLEELEGN